MFSCVWWASTAAPCFLAQTVVHVHPQGLTWGCVFALQGPDGIFDSIIKTKLKTWDGAISVVGVVFFTALFCLVSLGRGAHVLEIETKSAGIAVLCVNSFL